MNPDCALLVACAGRKALVIAHGYAVRGFSGALKGILLVAEAASPPFRRTHEIAKRGWNVFQRFVPASHLLAWADQAVVSAASFFVLVMLGRFTDVGQLGIYALGNSILAMLLGPRTR
jgi:hypothetical protein